MIPKEIKYNMHYDDVRGDFLRPPHGTTPALLLNLEYLVFGARVPYGAAYSNWGITSVL